MAKQDGRARAADLGRKFQATGKQIQGCGCALVLLVVIVLVLVSMAPKPGGIAGSAEGLEFKPIGNDIYTVVLPRDAEPEAIDRAARAHCAGKAMCDVWGWVDADKAATASPMTDRETMARIYSLKINRNTGYDRSVFACSVFARAPKDQCSEPQTEAELANAS
jgi:hypothetical protein